MMKSRLFTHAFILLCLIGVLDYAANTLYLYWTVWWIDMIMHFLSGSLVAMAMILVGMRIFGKEASTVSGVAFMAIAATLVVGVLWEVFELHFGITLLSDGMAFISDTASDVVLDVSGGLCGILYAYKLGTIQKVSEEK